VSFTGDTSCTLKGSHSESQQQSHSTHTLNLELLRSVSRLYNYHSSCSLYFVLCVPVESSILVLFKIHASFNKACNIHEITAPQLQRKDGFAQVEIVLYHKDVPKYELFMKKVVHIMYNDAITSKTFIDL
jgi:hypothetical protein